MPIGTVHLDPTIAAAAAGVDTIASSASPPYITTIAEEGEEAGESEEALSHRQQPQQASGVGMYLYVST